MPLNALPSVAIRAVSTVVAGLLLTACGTLSTPVAPPPVAAKPCQQPVGDNPPHGVDALLYQQRAVEFRVLTETTYAAASRALAEALASPAPVLAYGSSEAILPPAVVLDIDETVLDNGAYQARLINERRGHDDGGWDCWVRLGRATAIHGAGDYLRDAHRRGVAIWMITNRACRRGPGDVSDCPQLEATHANVLQALGLTADQLPRERVLLALQQPTWGSDKTSRRDYVAARHRILQLVGDDLGDFIPAGRARSLATRDAAATEPHWGTRWFLLPNAMYGSWMRSLEGRPKLEWLIDF